jgi:hypothetical protein
MKKYIEDLCDDCCFCKNDMFLEPETSTKKCSYGLEVNSDKCNKTFYSLKVLNEDFEDLEPKPAGGEEG